VAWDPITDPIDYVLIKGRKSPGLADVAGASNPENWDERRGYGFSGATIIYTGAGLANFSVTLRLYTEQDWADWNAWKELVAKPPTTRIPKALDIWHPLLEDLGIKSVVVKERHQPEQTDDGVWSVKIDFKQSRRRKFTLVKPEGSEATSDDPVDKLIENLSAQVQELAG